MKILLLATLVVMGVLAPTELLAQTRCRCSSSEWVGKCTATISQGGNWITVKTDTRQCARVDWYADEHPRLTIVVDGSAADERNAGARCAFQACLAECNRLV